MVDSAVKVQRMRLPGEGLTGDRGIPEPGNGRRRRHIANLWATDLYVASRLENGGEQPCRMLSHAVSQAKPLGRDLLMRVFLHNKVANSGKGFSGTIANPCPWMIPRLSSRF